MCYATGATLYALVSVIAIAQICRHLGARFAWTAKVKLHRDVALFALLECAYFVWLYLIEGEVDQKCGKDTAEGSFTVVACQWFYACHIAALYFVFVSLLGIECVNAGCLVELGLLCDQTKPRRFVVACADVSDATTFLISLFGCFSQYCGVCLFFRSRAHHPFFLVPPSKAALARYISIWFHLLDEFNTQESLRWWCFRVPTFGMGMATVVVAAFIIFRQ